MDFELDDEQKAIVDTVRAFVTRELYPHEAEVDRLNDVPAELVQPRGLALIGLHAGLRAGAAAMPQVRVSATLCARRRGGAPSMLRNRPTCRIGSL